MSACVTGRYTFRLPPSYVVGRIIGEGAYGVVCSANHTPSGASVAIKKIVSLDRRVTCLSTLREVKLLQHLQHENIIAILDIPQAHSYDKFKEIYLVQELMDLNLSEVLRVERLSNLHCQYFLYQILRGVKFIHSAGVLHRDLKPENLLVTRDCDLKICDFGLARVNIQGRYRSARMTEHVATRWYRAPENLFHSKEYTNAVDLWSIGCILAEMLGGRPLFPGDNHLDQVDLILGVLGSPTEEECMKIGSRSAMKYLMSLPRRKKQAWREIGQLSEASDTGLDMLSRLLVYDPQHRLTAQAALEHPYVDIYHDPQDEPVSELLELESFSFECQDASKETLRSKLRPHLDALYTV